MLVALLLSAAVLGLVFAAVIFRSDPGRYENRVFAALGALNSFVSGFMAVQILGGARISDPSTLRICSAIVILIALASVEFAYSFPGNRRMPKALHLPLSLYTAVAFVLLLHPGVRDPWRSLVSNAVTIPLFVLIVVFLVRNLRRAQGDPAALRLVAGALIFRWLVGMTTFIVVRPLWPEAFEASLVFETTAADLITYIVIGLGVMRSQLFSIRGAAAELIMHTALALAVLALTAGAVEAALLAGNDPGVRRVLLVLAALVPVAALWVFSRARERIAERFDRRRGLRKEIVSTAPRDADALLAYIVKGLGHMTDGRVRFVGPDSLPEGLAAHLTAAAYVHRTTAHDVPPGVLAALPGDLVVAVRGSQLHGALVIDGGRLDRDALLAALTLSDNLALTLENRRLFGELEESRRLAALGQFAAAIAHDIRTPLTSVQLNVQMLRRKASLPPDDMEHFDIALEELKRMEADVSQLLDFAKPVKIHTQPLDVREVADEATRRLEALFEERRLRFRTEHAADVPLVLADAERLRQVLVNLLDNAARASSDGAEVIIRTRAADDSKVAVDVSDGGTGIEPQNLPRIFEPFFTTRPDGTGLGLAICHKLVRAHAGEIQVRSSPGEGATFTVLLPAA